MTKHIALITYLVRDYDEAIAWFSRALGFRLFADERLSDTKRWVVMGPDAPSGARFLLAQPADAAQAAAIGQAAGGRVAFFLHSDDFARDHAAFTAAGVRFLEAPRHEAYGTVAVFEDLHGNKWDLLQPKG